MTHKLALALLIALTSPAAALTVTNDDGGRIQRYVEKSYAARGKRVVIDGRCASACTLYLSGNVCATSRATLVFHAATNNAGTRLLLASYPVRVKRWIRSRGGLSYRPLVAQGRLAQRLIGACT
jgi:hypothetical protein